MFYDGDTSFSWQNYFSHGEITYESKVLFDQMNVSERRTVPKNEVISTIKKKPRQFHMIKSNKEVTLKTRGTHFLYRKPQKLKFAKLVVSKFILKKLLKTFSSR